MQGITTLRAQLSAYTKVPQEKLMFEVRDVGGGFGQRTVAYPEYARAHDRRESARASR